MKEKIDWEDLVAKIFVGSLVIIVCIVIILVSEYNEKKSGEASKNSKEIENYDNR